MRKVCFITGSRADACPMRFVIRELENHKDVEVQKIETTGLYGNEEKVISELKRLKPNLVCLLGDRIETLLAAAIANSMVIPIAHIHGGEDTYGSTDNTNRYAISALSWLHFPCHNRYSERLQKMGENPKNIFVCGAPGVDALAEPRMTRTEIEASLGIHLNDNMALVCYHPETLGESLIPDKLIDVIEKHQGMIIISGANNDIGGTDINKFMSEAQKERGNIYYRESFPQKLWMSLMHEADVLIGNSSGFVFEGMTMGKKVIMIGNRQKGRYEDALEFFPTINEGWEEEADFYPYGIPGTVGKKIADILATIEIPKKPIKKLYATG